jgi:hypothetical protein
MTAFQGPSIQTETRALHATRFEFNVRNLR